jgi:poly-gamma-glutamate capsule biosynthesis protein CapA/YwtB (metallophosphatase superfamily)
MAKTAPIVRMFLCGDVMTGRGVDQALPFPSAPRIHEYYIKSAVEYLRLAERANGPIPQPLGFRDLWGAAAEELSCARPDARIINLETSITRSEAYAHKDINYRMSPENAAFLVAGGIDCCVLANNHILDWGPEGLRETLSVLRQLNIKAAGAGEDLVQAQAPAILEIPHKCRLIIFSFACVTSGTPRKWAATPNTVGVNLLPSLCELAVEEVAHQVSQARQQGDLVVVSIHWGPNWGYAVAESERWFAHELIARAGVSVVYGHSSHHPKAIEMFRNHLILYGCGDFLNDYEGINGYEQFRGDLALMYLADIDPTSGEVQALDLVPFQVRRFQLTHALREDVDWLRHRLDRESRKFDTCIMQKAYGRLVAQPLNVRIAMPC